MSQQRTLTLKAETKQRGFPLSGRVRGFTVSVDEPQLLGGTDRAPNPLEYLLLSQAGCLSIVIGMLAEKRKLRLEEVSVEASSNFELEGFLAGESVGLREIRLKVGLRSDEDLGTLRSLVEEAERVCPVRNTLSAKLHIEVERLQ